MKTTIYCFLFSLFPIQTSENRKPKVKTEKCKKEKKFNQTKFHEILRSGIVRKRGKEPDL